MAKPHIDQYEADAYRLLRQEAQDVVSELIPRGVTISVVTAEKSGRLGLQASVDIERIAPRTVEDVACCLGMLDLVAIQGLPEPEA